MGVLRIPFRGLLRSSVAVSTTADFEDGDLNGLPLRETLLRSHDRPAAGLPSKDEGVALGVLGEREVLGVLGVLGVAWRTFCPRVSADLMGVLHGL